MKPESMTVFQVFERQQRYIVPLFQRPYVWNQVDQWTPLWEDISTKARDVLLSRYTTIRKDLNKHFLGAIVLNQVDILGGLQLWSKVLIDGQQRLTTLQIILIALRDYAITVQHQQAITMCKHLTENAVSVSVNEEKYKIWPTNADREVFEKVYQAGSMEKLGQEFPLVYKPRRRYPEERPRLCECYFYFYKAIKSFLEDDDPDGILPVWTVDQRMDALLEAFRNYLEIVTIDLDKQDNPQVIFETLNYRGTPLTPSDLIRNFVFLRAGGNGKPLNDLHQKYWLDYDRPASNGNAGFWKQTEGKGRHTRQRMDLFVYHYLTSQTATDVSIPRIYQEFKDWWDEQPRDVETELARLQKYSHIFLSFYLQDATTRQGVFLKRLRMLQNTTVYPLLLFLFGEDHQLSSAEMNSILVDLESYLVRRMVCTLPARAYNVTFLSLLEELRKEGSKGNLQGVLRKALLQHSSESNRWPNDEEFKASWLSKDAYRLMRGGMLLEALETYLITPKQENVQINAAMTIEHVLPQGWDEINWPLPAIQSGDSRDMLVIKRNAILQTIGNLTLLTQPLNSSVSNGPFKQKREAIAGQSQLRLNSYFQKPRDMVEWNEQDIVDRAKRLFEIACQIWPYPNK